MTFASWKKCDFQVHTPRDPNWSGTRPPGLGEEVAGSPADVKIVEQARDSWAEDFVDQCIKRGLEAIAITDHHEMVMVPYIQKAIAKRAEVDDEFVLWLFPGMELTCRNGTQCLIIFDCELPEEWWREAQARLGIVVADQDETARQSKKVTQLDFTYPKIAELLDSVGQLNGRYIVLPNVSEGGKHTVLTKGAHADFKSMPYVGGYLDKGQTLDTLGPTNLRRLSGQDSAWGARYIFPLPTSDSRSADFASLGSNHCWIKLATPTAEGVRQAFLGHQSRISTVNPGISSLAVRSFSVTGSGILADSQIELSPELNSFIGGRGSGKSTALEYISFGLGKSCHDLNREDYSGNDRLAGLIKDTLIAKGATLELVVEQDGAKFYVRRGGDNSYLPKITYPDGTSQELSQRELRSLFPSVVYSQGELSEIGKQAGKRSELSDLLQFVEPEFKLEDERLRTRIDEAKLSVRSALQELSGAWLKQAEIQKLKTKKSSLEQRIAAVRKTLPQLSAEDQVLIKRHDSLAAFDARRRQAELQVNSVMDDLAELWKTSRQPIDLTSEIPEANRLEDAYEKFNAAFAGGIDQFGKGLASYRDELLAAGSVVSVALSNAKVMRDTAMEKFTEHRSVTAQVLNLQKELQMTLTQIGELQVTAVSSQARFVDFKSCITNLKEAASSYSDQTRAWAKKIEFLSGGRVEARLNVDGNRQEILDAVDTIAAKTGSQEATRHRNVNRALENDGVWPFLDAIRADCLSIFSWKQVGSLGQGEMPNCSTLSEAIGATSRMLSQSFEAMDLSRLEAISTAVPKPDITLFYSDGTNKISFEKASEGQRAAALLFMLLEQTGGPLIVDQPEGDLDNKIVSELAEKLHEAKQKRQIIFASHNANLVVNGSSELVVGMDVTPDARRAALCTGAIDRNEVCQEITETMEGGEQAFRARKDKYGY